MAALAIPLGVTLAELVGAMVAAAGVTAGVIVLANKDLPAGMRQWIAANEAKLDEWAKKKERREPTPATHPPLFKTDTLSGTKVRTTKQ